jgi:hypothetical protein
MHFFKIIFIACGTTNVIYLHMRFLIILTYLLWYLGFILFSYILINWKKYYAIGLI